MKQAVPAGRQGFTLVELLIVIAIIALMVVMAVGILNPGAQMAKANDARRKKDLGRIKVAFEEYFNDNGCYPSNNDSRYPGMLDSLMDKSNCNTGVFSRWGLEPWPCDPVTRLPYYIYPELKSCPSWFKILTNLDNRKDTQIPVGWYNLPNLGYYFGDGLIGSSQVNFGVSSPNVSWYDRVLNPHCWGYPQCLSHNDTGFNGLGAGTFHDAYAGPYLDCYVECCVNGSVCP